MFYIVVVFPPSFYTLLAMVAHLKIIDTLKFEVIVNKNMCILASCRREITS